MKSRRIKRVDSEVEKSISEAINQYVADNLPNTLIGVTKVSVSPDLANARISLSIFCLNKEMTVEAVFNEVVRKANVIREYIASHVRLRIVPYLTFDLDRGNDAEDRVNQLLSQIKNQKEN